MIPIKVEIGLNINNKIEYIPLGIFNIDSVKKDDFTIKITAYDNMSKFKSPYFSSLGDIATLTQVANEIATKTGVQFEGNLPAYTVKKLEGLSCREVLSFIASLCGGNAIIKRNGKFTIVYPTEISRDIGEGVFDFTREEVKYKIGKITCKVEDKTLSKGSLGADSMEMQFENPWVNESILTDIYNRLNGYEYLGYNLKWQGDPSLDIGDIITYKDDKGVIRKLPIFNRKLSYDGGLDSELSAKGETKNKNSFDSSGSMKKKIDRVVTELAIVNEALIDVAYIGDLTAGNIKFDTASGTIMDLQTLLAKFVTGENGQFLNLTTDNVVIANAVIKDAMIDSLSLNKLKAGSIDTNKINLASADGGLTIVGPTMQFKDKSNKVRLQLGQDTAGDFNFILRAADGTTTLIDGYGIKEKAIADNLIKEKMIAENAVGEKQINYSSLITGLNKDTNTSLIKASKVAIDLTGQSLEVSFNSLKSNIDSKESRNLLIGEKLIIQAGTVTKEKISDYHFKFTNTQVNNTHIMWNGNNGLSINAKAGEYITVSFFIKSSFKTQCKIIGKSGIANIEVKTYNVIVSEDLQKVVLTSKVLIDNPEIFIYFSDYRVFNEFGVLEIKDWKLEMGENRNPVWSIAPEDTDSKIKSNTTAITVAQGKIEGIVKESTIIKGDVTTLKDNYTSIKATVDGINSTVSSHTSSIGALHSNVSTMQGSITQLNNKIALKVEATEVNNIVNNAVDSIQVGGRNLYKGTGDFNNNYWIADNIQDFELDLKYKQVLTKGYNTSGFRLSTSTAQQGFDFSDSSKTWTITAWVKAASEGQTLGVTLDGGRLDYSSQSITTSWKRYSWTFNGNSSLTTFRFEGNSIQKADGCYIAQIKVEEGNKPTDWTPANEDIAESISTVDKKVTTTSSKVASIETNLSNITQRVSSTESTVSTINGNVTNLTSRVSTAESKLTATSLTTTISSAINAGTSSITTTQFIMDKTGLTVKNGSIKIQNNAGANVLSADTNGNLRLTGRLDNVKDGRSVTIDNGMVYAYTNNILNFSLGNNTLAIYDYFDTSKQTLVGQIFSTKTSSNGILGMGLSVDKNQQLGIGYNVTSSSYSPFMRFNKDMNYGVQYPINVLEDMFLYENKSLGFGRNPEIGGTPHFVGDMGWLKLNIPSQKAGRGFYMYNSYTAQLYMSFQEGQTYRAWIEPSCYVNGNFFANGNIACSGAKTRVVETENYSKLRLNAYETADCLFADYGSGIIGEDELCYIALDDKFLETINIKRNYQIFLTAIDREDRFEDIKLKVVKKEPNYFVVKGNKGLEFDWNIVAKQRNYEDERLVDHDRTVLMETEDTLKFNLLSSEDSKDNVRKIEELLTEKVVITEDLLLSEVI